MPKSNEALSALLSTYRYCVGFGVPLVVLVIGIVGKKVARGRGWKEEDFYACSELALAGVSGSLVNLFEFLKPERITLGLLEKALLGANIGIAVLGLLGYWLTLSLRQDYRTKAERSSRAGRVLLLGISNAVGMAVLFGAFLMMLP